MNSGPAEDAPRVGKKERETLIDGVSWESRIIIAVGIVAALVFSAALILALRARRP